MDTPTHDVDAIGGAAAGGFGGLVQWLRLPDGWKKLGGWVGAGLICGFLANASLKYFFPDWSWDLRWGVAAVAGLGSADLVIFALKAMNRLTTVADQQINTRFGVAPNAADGRNATAAPGNVVAVAVVPVGGANGGLAGNGVVFDHGVGGKGTPTAGS